MSLIKKNTREAQPVHRLEATPVSRVEENENAFTLTVEMPGVNEKEIDLTLENRTLSITAENNLQVFQDHTLVMTEIPEVRYRTAFDLPERVDTGAITAVNKNGLLILTLPKREEVKPRRIAIATS